MTSKWKFAQTVRDKWATFVTNTFLNVLSSTVVGGLAGSYLTYSLTKSTAKSQVTGTHEGYRDLAAESLKAYEDEFRQQLRMAQQLPPEKHESLQNALRTVLKKNTNGVVILKKPRQAGKNTQTMLAFDHAIKAGDAAEAIYVEHITGWKDPNLATEWRSKLLGGALPPDTKYRMFVNPKKEGTRKLIVFNNIEHYTDLTTATEVVRSLGDTFHDRGCGLVVVMTADKLFAETLSALNGGKIKALLPSNYDDMFPMTKDEVGAMAKHVIPKTVRTAPGWPAIENVLSKYGSPGLIQHGKDANATADGLERQAVSNGHIPCN